MFFVYVVSHKNEIAYTFEDRQDALDFVYKSIEQQRKKTESDNLETIKHYEAELKRINEEISKTSSKPELYKLNLDKNEILEQIRLIQNKNVELNVEPDEYYHRITIGEYVISEAVFQLKHKD